MHASSKALTFSWRRFLSYRNQSIDLFCKSMNQFLYNRNLLHERFKIFFIHYTESLFLHVVKHNLLFFFFLSGFPLRIFKIPLPPASETPIHQLGYCCRELTCVHSWQPQSNMDPLVHALQNLLFLQLHWQLLLLGECLKLG